MTPPHGPKNSTGKICRAMTRPSAVPEPVSLSTSSPWATVCIQVPALRDALADGIQAVVTNGERGEGTLAEGAQQIALRNNRRPIRAPPYSYITSMAFRNNPIGATTSAVVATVAMTLSSRSSGMVATTADRTAPTV